MKTKLLILLAIGSFLIFSAYGQGDVVSNADTKISEINSYKKYEIEQLTQERDLKMLGDSLVSVTMYKKKDNMFGKDVHEFKIGTLKKSVTYYFNKNGVFAIDEQMVVSATDRKKLRYYFAPEQFFKVIDENGNDQTGKVDKGEIYDRIIMLYGRNTIVK